MFAFFFSSRRRHTRWPRDWSSDVCSSDLWSLGACGGTSGENGLWCHFSAAATHKAPTTKIGRASCRERVEVSVVGGGVREKLGAGCGVGRINAWVAEPVWRWSHVYGQSSR